MKKYPPTWPDGTSKSMNNAFNWRTGAPSVATPARTLPARAQDLNSNGSIYTYTTAGKTPYGRTKPFTNLNAKI